MSRSSSPREEAPRGASRELPITKEQADLLLRLDAALERAREKWHTAANTVTVHLFNGSGFGRTIGTGSKVYVAVIQSA